MHTIVELMYKYHDALSFVGLTHHLQQPDFSLCKIGQIEKPLLVTRSQTYPLQ